MQLKRLLICLIILSISHEVFGQKIHQLNYSDVYNNDCYKLPFVNSKDSNKIVVLIFTKDSDKFENTWLLHLEDERILDTAHFIFFKINFPVTCSSPPQKKCILINNLNLFNFPDSHLQNSFQIILVANENSKKWALKKLGTSYENLFATIKNENPLSKEKNSKLKLAKAYTITEKKYKEDFLYLISKNSQYNHLIKLQDNFKDSFFQLNNYYHKLDSISKLTSKHLILLDLNISPICLSTGSKHPTTTNVKQTNIVYSNISSRLPLQFNVGVGMTNILFTSNINIPTSHIGKFRDLNGDLYSSNILNVVSFEEICTNNYNLNLGLNFYRKFKNCSFTMGAQFNFNSRPEIQSSKIILNEGIIESKKYEVLNFDEIKNPINIYINNSNNFMPYFNGVAKIGLFYEYERFYLHGCINFVTSSNLIINTKSRFLKDSESVIYNPEIYTTPTTKIQTYCLNLSLGYEI